MSLFSQAFTVILDILFPPTCPICKKRILTHHNLCGDCFGKIRFITKPCCIKCGRPFEFELEDELVCGVCLKGKQVFHKARTAFCYDDFSKQLILPFKHSDHIELTPLLTKFLVMAGKDLFDEIDVIMPVPLHRLRFIKRKYNQAGLLSKSLSAKINKPFVSGVLIRSRRTVSQGHLKKLERQKNVSHAFRVKNADKIKGKHILLIDDVYTTGATLNECAKTLKRMGATKVSYLTLARVFKLK